MYIMEYYTTERKELPFKTAWMELESIVLSEIGHTAKNKYHMISCITNEQNIMNETDKQAK